MTDMTNNKTLAIVDSPLQVMMANEFINEFEISNVDFLVSVHSIDYLRLNRSVLRYLNDIGANYRVVITKDLFRILRYVRSPKVYERFIIGDFRSLDKKLLMLFHAKRRFDIVYVDDGNASFEFETGFSSAHGPSRFISSLVDTVIQYRAKDRVYYSAFIKEGTLKGVRVIPNQIRSLCMADKEVSDDIIIIGCFTSFFETIGMNYQEMLVKLNNYIHVKWGNNPIRYYPHRRENDICAIKDFCKTVGWDLCFSRINIELELSCAEKRPKAIVGFGSSALFLLKKIGQGIDVETIHFVDSDDYLNIERVYKDNGINVITL